MKILYRPHITPHGIVSSVSKSGKWHPRTEQRIARNELEMGCCIHTLAGDGPLARCILSSFLSHNAPVAHGILRALSTMVKVHTGPRGGRYIETRKVSRRYLKPKSAVKKAVVAAKAKPKKTAVAKRKPTAAKKKGSNARPKVPKTAMTQNVTLRLTVK